MYGEPRGDLSWTSFSPQPLCLSQSCVSGPRMQESYLFNTLFVWDHPIIGQFALSCQHNELHTWAVAWGKLHWRFIHGLIYVFILILHRFSVMLNWSQFLLLLARSRVHHEQVISLSQTCSNYITDKSHCVGALVSLAACIRKISQEWRWFWIKVATSAKHFEFFHSNTVMFYKLRKYVNGKWSTLI